MKFTATLLALATAVSAGYVSNGTVAYTTEVVTALTTYCPYATTLSHNGVTYTVTEATTLTITNCPCTVTKPLTTSTIVACTTCGYNSTAPPPVVVKTTAVGTGSPAPTKSTTPPPAVTAGASALTISGAGLALVMGVAALL